MTTKVNKSVIELAIVKKVLTLLNIGEDAKIGNFFAKEVKKAEKAIRDLKRNLTTLENSYNDDVDDITEKLVDADEAVEDAKVAVTLEDVKNNDAANSFAYNYWYNVDGKLAEVARLVKSLKEKEEAYRKSVEAQQDQIDKYQARIDMIKKD